MLPSGGWDTEYLNADLIPPRDEWKYALIGKAGLFSDPETVWTLTWAAGVFTLVDDSGIVQLTLPITGVVNCDLTFDQEDRPILVWEGAASISYIRYYDTGTLAYIIVSFTGKNPCCCVDNLRDNLPTDSDVIVFFQRDWNIFYLLQREDYLVDHAVPSDDQYVKLITCGMSTDNRLSVKVEKLDCILFAIGTKPMVIGDDYVGYPTGVVPWDRN